jgi:hypothetical protein
LVRIRSRPWHVSAPPLEQGARLMGYLACIVIAIAVWILIAPEGM